MSNLDRFTALHQAMSGSPNGSNGLPRDARALIVLNPYAGQASSLRQNVEEARNVWLAHGWTVDVETTQDRKSVV